MPFWEFFTSKASVVQALKRKVHFLSYSYALLSDIFGARCVLRVCDAFLNRSAVFCLFIISNSQLGCIVCEGLFERWKSFFQAVLWGLCETSNALQLLHTVECIIECIISMIYPSCVHYSFVAYCESCMMIIYSLCLLWCCAAWSFVGLLFEQKLINVKKKGMLSQNCLLESLFFFMNYEAWQELSQDVSIILRNYLTRIRGDPELKRIKDMHLRRSLF